MANRNWRSGGAYQSFNPLLNPMPYYHQMNYSNDRKNYGGRVSYRDDNYKRERKDFQSGRRDRISPNRRRSPYQRSHDSHGNFRRDSKKSHGRYEVKAPRLTFDIKELSTSSLKVRYPKMYIPSDFFHAHLKWQEVFPLYRTMKLGNHSEFQILHKDVEFDEFHSQPEELSENLEPIDANYSYSAKVMLMTMPNFVELYKSVCSRDGYTTGSGKNFSKNIQFLVGSKGKNEPMAIGGPWSPSLDGQNPDKDPTVLVNTAIRTCNSLVGIDLSKCKKWYKFLEIHYYRPLEKHNLVQHSNLDKENDNVNKDEARVEKVVIFVPDIWSCVPSESDWAELKSKFDKKLASLITTDVPDEKMDESVELHLSDEIRIDEDTGDNQNLQQMKVVELKAELSSRGLDTKGVKAHLVKRLQEALDNERGKTATENPENKLKQSEMVREEKLDDVAVTEVPVETDEIKKAEENKELSEKEKKRIEKLYKLNEKPSILVQPNKKAKASRFECCLMTLENLLEYRVDDQKEHIFELSLFAEQINEMIQRDAAFYIFQSLSELPELVSESNEPALKKAKIENVDQVCNLNPIRKSKVIVDINLLFSFSVFDYDNCGYIKDHDLEDIIHSIGLNFSRSQVRKLISKIPNKRGSLMYKEVIDKEVIEGSNEDIAVLKDKKLVSQRTVELSMGNKTYFEECDVQEMITRIGNLHHMDKLTAVEFKKKDYESQLILIKEELEKIKAIQNDSGDVETNLKESISKIEEKLEIERETFNKLSQFTKVYNSILKSAADNMGLSIKTINDQFEQERLLIEELKAKEESENKMETENLKETETSEKKWQVVDQV